MDNFTGKEYLMIDFANHYGKDKLTWNERLEWAKEFLKKSPEDIKIFIKKEAEEPVEAFAAFTAIQDAEKGIPSGYAVSLDATSSGAQILACLTRDVKAAKLCNVLSTKRREDLYSNIYQQMLRSAGNVGVVSRADVKQAIMTALYGSKAVPKMVFGEGTKMLEIFEETMRRELPQCWKLNQDFLDIWCSDALKYSWQTPDLFTVELPVMAKVTELCYFNGKAYEIVKEVNQPIKQGRFLSADVAHSIDGYFVREMVRRCSYDPKKIDWISRTIVKGGFGEVKGTLRKLLDMAKETGIWSYRILDHLNKSNIYGLAMDDKIKIMDMICNLPAEPFEVYTIHDCFKCLPNHGNEVRRIYNSLLSELWRSDFLNYIMSEISNEPIKVCHEGIQHYKDILNADYALS